MNLTHHSLVSLATLACLAGSAHAQSFTPMGDLPGGNFQSQGSSISADGSVACGHSDIGAGNRGFRWTPGAGMVQLSGPPVGLTDCRAYDVSGDGSIAVGQMIVNGVTMPYRWTQATGMVALPAWTSHPTILGLNISYDGSTVSGSATTGAYRYTTGGGYTEIPLLAGASSSTGYGLSGDGSTVVGYCDGPAFGDSRAFRWTSGTGTQYLGDLPGNLNYSIAYGASYDGSVIVGESYGTAGDQPFRWTAGSGMVSLGNFVSPVPNGGASACSGNGSVIVGYSRLGDDYEAFVWDLVHGLRTVRAALFSVGVTVPAGWKLTFAQSVSYDGSVIVGQGTNPQGNAEGWVARLRPSCPGDLNADGVVNTQDLTIFLGNFGKNTIPLLNGDHNGSGSVNTQDLTQFLGVFGHAC